MAGLAHLGIALIATLIVPEVHVVVLIICAYLLDIIFMLFMVLGLDELPKKDRVTSAPWSHSFLMAIIWSVLAVLVYAFISRDFNISIIIGLIVFSHWLVDFIAKPMTSVFPNDNGLLLHPFGGSREVGLGMWRSRKGLYTGEYGTLILGALVFISTIF